MVMPMQNRPRLARRLLIASMVLCFPAVVYAKGSVKTAVDIQNEIILLEQQIELEKLRGAYEEERLKADQAKKQADSARKGLDQSRSALQKDEILRAENPMVHSIIGVGQNLVARVVLASGGIVRIQVGDRLLDQAEVLSISPEKVVVKSLSTGNIETLRFWSESAPPVSKSAENTSTGFPASPSRSTKSRSASQLSPYSSGFGVPEIPTAIPLPPPSK